MMISRFEEYINKQEDKKMKEKFECFLSGVPENYRDHIVVYMDTLRGVNSWNDDHDRVLDGASMVELTKCIVELLQTDFKIKN